MKYSESTALIVDDSEIGREVLAAGLRLDSLRIEVAGSGPEAIEKANLFRPDIVLLDVMMPGMNGFEVCEKLREQEALAEVPILLVTSLDDRNSRLRGLAAGADDFIARPVDMLELRARVRAICRLNRYRKIVQERARVGQLFDFAPHGIVLLDQELRILAINPAMHGLLRLPSSISAVGRSIIDWIVDQRRVECRELLDAAFEQRSNVYHFETEVKDETGQCRLVDLSLAPCPWQDATALQVFFHDSTERRRATEAAERMLRFNAIASSAFEIVHKFNNFLSVISLNAELLEPEDPSVAAITEACEHASILSDRILAFARRDMEAILVPIDIDQFLGDMIPSLAALIGSSHQILLEQGVGDEFCAIADQEQLRDVLMSLVLNARDAMSDGGVIEMSTAIVDEDVAVIVRDTGDGMTEAVRRSLFEPFFTTRREKGNTGLGLSTASDFVDKWGGRIEVGSTLGEGATFTVIIPGRPDR